MNLNQLLSFITPFISAFCGAFFANHFFKKQRFKGDKKEVYNALIINYLPVNIPISQGDLSLDYLAAGSPESSIRMLNIKIEHYEEQLKRHGLTLTLEQRGTFETEISNCYYVIKKLEQYIKFFDETLKRLAEFEHSHFFNLFKIYANNNVRNAYVHLNIALNNDYYSIINIPSEKLNILLEQLLLSIKADLNK